MSPWTHGLIAQSVKASRGTFYSYFKESFSDECHNTIYNKSSCKLNTFDMSPLQHSDVCTPLPVFSYIFLLWSPEAVQWWLERHHFSGVCSSGTISVNDLFLGRNVPATIYSWTFRHVIALISVSPYMYRYVYVSENKKNKSNVKCH